MSKRYRVDLHIHTCLSPCGDLEMTPRNIIKKALDMNLNAIAIADHNTGENVVYCMAAARGTSLTIIPAMEVTSREEVHILALFPDLDRLLDMQREIYLHLHPGENKDEIMGIQAVVNENDEVESVNRLLLIAGTFLSMEQLVERIHSLQGLAIASHIDREAFGVLGQLGFIPPGIPFDALEVSSAIGYKAAREKFSDCSRFPFIRSSDAHRIVEIGSACTIMELEKAELPEIRLSLLSKDGRAVIEE